MRIFTLKTKFILTIGFILSFCFFGLSAFSATLGDVNDNGKIDIVDALLVAQYTAQMNITVTFNTAAAEVSGDGAINIVDALLIARYASGLITQFPAGPISTTPSPTNTPAPVITVPLDDGIEYTELTINYPETVYVFLLRNLGGADVPLDWHLYSIQSGTYFSFSRTTGTLASGQSDGVAVYMSWENLSGGIPTTNQFYLYTTSSTSTVRYCKLLSITFLQHGPTSTPTQTVMPCGKPNLGVSPDTRTLTLKYPASSFAFHIFDSTNNSCESSYRLVVPVPHNDYISLNPLSGSAAHPGSTPYPTPTPTGTPGPRPSPLGPGDVVGSLRWDEVPPGGSLNYYLILFMGATYNATPQRRIITIVADRTAAP